MGAELEIPTIDGKVKYTLPAGTQSGTTFRLRGKGIPELRGRGRGDQYVTVKVQVPTSLDVYKRQVCGLVLGLSINWVYLGYVIENVVKLCLGVWRLRSGKWIRDLTTALPL